MKKNKKKRVIQHFLQVYREVLDWSSECSEHEGVILLAVPTRGGLLAVYKPNALNTINLQKKWHT